MNKSFQRILPCVLPLPLFSECPTFRRGRRSVTPGRGRSYPRHRCLSWPCYKTAQGCWSSPQCSWAPSEGERERERHFEMHPIIHYIFYLLNIFSFRSHLFFRSWFIFGLQNLIFNKVFQRERERELIIWQKKKLTLFLWIHNTCNGMDQSDRGALTTFLKSLQTKSTVCSGFFHKPLGNFDLEPSLRWDLMKNLWTTKCGAGPNRCPSVT